MLLLSIIIGFVLYAVSWLNQVVVSILVLLVIESKMLKNDEKKMVNEKIKWEIQGEKFGMQKSHDAT